ncbi:protein phosphatase CheZ [Thiomicrorhabdus sediminis]|uniref:Protein phosphatase CheZ n=1 Tax=Thiomicrorhabdus sediminis TaxID=2580412 RepID=A0A4P9K5W6_9GAMM|nr:protein phosphatase CheZ [Thiomicrorhabdus sediminis]QCU90434.1 protein phosphatase CheZ [Thiomicrorhabdus sediminis]
MTVATDIPVEKVQALLEALQSNQAVEAGQLLDELTQIRESEIYHQVSQLTHDLHETLDHLEDDQLLMQTKHDIPDAAERLQYVISTTEEASAKTLDKAEEAIQSLEKLEAILASERVNQEEQTDCVALLHQQLTEIMLAQSFQDLTGQVLNRVILVISSLEQSLIELIEKSGRDYHAIPDRVADADGQKADEMKGVGPNVTQKSKQDIVSSQEDIDDLLSDLGI